MFSSLEQWFRALLGQWYYVLGYCIVLFSHNWPLILAGIVGVWSAIRAFQHPSRAALCWLYGSAFLALDYEYQKHVASELHRAVDFLAIGDLYVLNAGSHILVSPGVTILLFAASSGFFIYGMWLVRGRHDYVPEPRLHHRHTDL